MKSIPTVYKGVQMRSCLEATWAAVFDHYGIRWLYEPEAYEFSDGTRYIPDFYLPDAKEFFEVKGVMTDVDMHKVEMLMKESNKSVIIGNPDGSFVAPDCYYIDIDTNQKTLEFSNYDDPQILCKCQHCGNIVFEARGAGAWLCASCGKYQGDICDILTDRIPNFETFRPHYQNPKWRRHA